MSGWVRLRGRVDYAGWKIHARGTKAEMIAGHPADRCIAFWVLWRLGVIRSHPLLGKVIWMKVYRPGQEEQR